MLKHFTNGCAFLSDVVSAQSQAAKSFRSYCFSFTFTCSISVYSLYRTLNTRSNTDTFAFQITTLTNWKQRDCIVSIKRTVFKLHLYITVVCEKQKNQEIKKCSNSYAACQTNGSALLALPRVSLHKLLGEAEPLRLSQRQMT